MEAKKGSMSAGPMPLRRAVRAKACTTRFVERAPATARAVSAARPSSSRDRSAAENVGSGSSTVSSAMRTRA